MICFNKKERLFGRFVSRLMDERELLALNLYSIRHRMFKVDSRPKMLSGQLAIAGSLYNVYI